VATTIDPRTGAETETSSAETYDFRAPQRIAKEQWALVQTVCTRSAVALQAVLSTRLRQSVTVALGRVEEMPLADALVTLATPCAAYVFDPGNGNDANGVLDLGAPLASYAVDRLLGGPGAILDAPRALTEMEQRVIKDLVERTLAALGLVLKDYGQFKLAFVGSHSTPENLAEAIATDGVVLATFDVAAEQPVGTVTLCMPVTALGGLAKEQRSPSRAGRASPAVRQDARTNLEAAIRRASVPVMVRFPAITLPARAVAMLTPGQTIQTALPLDVPVEVRVSGRLRFLGAPGQVHGTVGVRIVRTVPADAGVSPAPTRARIL
jgi:flagellar motor switch protein FliM